MADGEDALVTLYQAIRDALRTTPSDSTVIALDAEWQGQVPAYLVVPEGDPVLDEHTRGPVYLWHGLCWRWLRCPTTQRRYR